MPVANFKSYQKNNSNFKKNEFISLPIGQHTIRVLSLPAKVFETHYIHGYTLMCLGDDCPICQNNRKMWTEFGKEARNTPGYSAVRQIGILNVLDRTPVKVCPNTQCQQDVKKVGTQFPPTCPKCGASLVSVPTTPMNKVKILSKGKQFFDQLEFHDAAILDANETPIGIVNYDLDILVMNDKTAPTVSARPDRNDVVSVPEDALFDLETAVIKLTAEEIYEVLRGISLKDIFAARKSSRQETTAKNTGVDLDNQINSIFEN